MATLTVNIIENLVLNNQQVGSKTTLSFDNIEEVFKRRITCTQGQTTTVAVFNTDPHGAANAIDVADVEYIRVKNLETGTTADKGISIAMVGASDHFEVMLPPGGIIIFPAADDIMLANNNTSPQFTGWEDLASMQVKPKSTNNVSIELLIATK